MAKSKIKNVDSLAQELKNLHNNLETGMKIGVVVFADNIEGSFSYNLANTVKSQVLKNNVECEVITMPNIGERFRIFSSQNYVLSSFKKIVADMLELVLFDKNLDGVVFIPNGFSTTLGCLFGSIRLNLPTLVLPVGISRPQEGKNLLDVLSIPGEISNNLKSVFDLEKSAKEFCEYNGSGSTLTSQNLLNIILEIMELAPKNSSTTYADSFEKEQQAKQAGNDIVGLTKNRLPLKKLINKKSINNALMLNFCLGGNPTILHAIHELCVEAEIDLDFNKMLSLNKNAPVMFNTYQGMQKYIEFGGTWALIKAMVKSKIIDGNYKTFSDSTLLDVTKQIKNYENFALIKKESLIVMHGNVADKYALVKSINLPEEKTKVIGNAQVFNSDEEACNAVLNKAIEQNSIIVIKNCGKNTQTGLSTIAQTAIAIKSMGLENQYVILTDGVVSEDIDVISISCVCPDSECGNIKYLKDGDEIEIDFVKGKINAEVGGREFMLRQKKYINDHLILPKYLKTK
ncbi:MAG: dihydroxy-acid dehydratase [Clostridia bacterium]|nr:dihydroxy-acid dehydratase [Clostridia bacterium]